MKGARRWVRWSIASLALALVCFLVTRREAGSERPASSDFSDRTGSADAPQATREAVDGPGVELGEPESRREAATASGGPVRLRCTGDHEVLGATASWTPMEPAFFGPWVGWSTQAWARIASATHEVTLEQGVLWPPPEAVEEEGHPLALWVTHPEHAPHLTLFPGRVELPNEITLEHVDPMRVRVVMADGEPISDATVEQLVDVPQNALADTWDPQAARVLRRTFRTDQNGTTPVAGWQGWMVLRAASGGQVSETWIGEPRGEVQLVLHPTFEVEGEVAYPMGAMEGPQRVVCSVQRGGQSQVLAVSAVESGRFGPVRLPCLDVDGFLVRLEGWNAEVREQRIEPQEPGVVVRVNFDALPGLDVWALAQTPDGEPILNSTIVARWAQDGSFVEALGHSREDGHVLIRGVPRCSALLRARAEGFAAETNGPFTIPPDPPATFVVDMFPGREIRGTVTRLGNPVEDFEITAWDWDINYHFVETFREREDGSFTIRSRAGPTTTVVATAQGHGPSRAVEVPPDQKAPVTLELRELVLGRGRVVDALTGTGIEEATVQAFVAAELGQVSPVAASRSASSTGEFEYPSFPVGRSRVRFRAPGYATHWEEVFGVPGGVLDLGSIGLRTARDLEVRLVSEDPIDATEYSLHGFGADPVPYRRFDADGRALVPGISPGSYRLHVEGPRSARIWAELEAGDDWLVEIPVGGGHTLVVNVPLGGRSDANLWLRVQVSSPSGPAVEFVRELGAGGRLDFTGLPTGPYSVYLTPDWGPPIASASGRLHEGEEVQEIELRTHGEAWPIAVATVEGTPAAGASVRARDVEAHTYSYCTLDERGRGDLEGLEPGREYMAFVRHPELGLDPEIPVELPPSKGEPIQLVFDPRFAVELILLDGTEPVSGARCSLSDSDGAWEVLSTKTSEPGSGRVRWGPLGPGEYEVAIEHPTLWARDAIVAADEPGLEVPVQVRRIGDLSIEFGSQSGQTCAGKSFGLSSLEFGADVGKWLSDGRVVSTTGSLRADASGLVTISGLPRGSYALVTSGYEMTAEVLPGEVSSVSVLLP